MPTLKLSLLINVKKLWLCYLKEDIKYLLENLCCLGMVRATKMGVTGMREIILERHAA